SISYFFFHLSAHPLDPHSFPTRRSSDLFRLGSLIGTASEFGNGHRLAMLVILLQSLAIPFGVLPVPIIIDAHQVEQPPVHFFPRSEEHTSELQSQSNLVCRLLLEKKKKK